MSDDFPDGDTAADVTTLARLLQWRAERHPDRVGYVFLSDGEAAEVTVSYGALDRRARTIAAQLSSAGAVAGDRALLLFPPGSDFLEAFFGCLYAGVIAVPAFPPDPSRLDRTLPRLLSVVADATPVAALTVAPLLAHVELLAGMAPQFGALRWIATDTAPDPTASGWAALDIDGGATAMLQYTSGSTGTPKGVVLSHRNCCTTRASSSRSSAPRRRVAVSVGCRRTTTWGSSAACCSPCTPGCPTALMSPMDFLRDPLRWLQALSRLRATMSGGPNFAYDLCVRKTTPRAARTARPELMAGGVQRRRAGAARRHIARFAEAFAPAGFRARGVPALLRPGRGDADRHRRRHCRLHRGARRPRRARARRCGAG